MRRRRGSAIKILGASRPISCQRRNRLQNAARSGRVCLSKKKMNGSPDEPEVLEKICRWEGIFLAIRFSVEKLRKSLFSIGGIDFKSSMVLIKLGLMRFISNQFL